MWQEERCYRNSSARTEDNGVPQAATHLKVSFFKWLDISFVEGHIVFAQSLWDRNGFTVHMHLLNKIVLLPTGGRKSPHGMQVCALHVWRVGTGA